MSDGAMALVARDLKATGDGRIGKLLNRQLAAVVIPMRAAVVSEIDSIPANGTKSTGLRSAMARAAKIRFGLGGNYVRLEMSPSAMPPGKGSLPADIEGKGWKHPVFGHQNTKVFQPGHPYFFPTIDARMPALTAGVVAVADKTIAMFTRGKL